MLLESALRETALEGTIVHKRRREIRHAFEYRVWMALSRLDGSALPWLLKPRLRKYLPANRVLAVAGLPKGSDARIWLLTQPSLIGRSFNPVSFYFVTVGTQVRAVVAHVTNTPWDEEHCYLLEGHDGNTWVFDKQFHVSPFLPMGLRYRWRFGIGGDRIHIHIQLLEDADCVFTATLNLRAVAPSVLSPLRLRIRYPLQNLTTLGRIYWQAAVLKIKGARFYAHPDDARPVHDRLR